MALDAAKADHSGFRYHPELLALLVQNRVSTRRAAVLAYITNQLLRTLHAMDRETYGDPDAPPTIIFDGPRPIRDDPPTQPS